MMETAKYWEMSIPTLSNEMDKAIEQGNGKLVELLDYIINDKMQTIYEERAGHVAQSWQVLEILG